MATLITGASSGIGKRITEDLLCRGEIVLALGKRKISKNQYEEFWGKVNIQNLTYYSIDLASKNSLLTKIDHFISKSIFIDKLVHAAGIVDRSDFLSMSRNSWDDVLIVNLTSAMILTQSILPKMIDNKFGRMVFITSQMGTIPHPFASPSYSVSKAGLHALSKNLALHYSKFNVLCNCVAPGSIQTPMFMSLPKSRQESIQADIPINFLGSEVDLSEMVDFLLFRNNYITGQEIHVNGGSLMH